MSDPSTISGCVLWFTAATPSTLTTDPAATYGDGSIAGTDRTRVAQWFPAGGSGVGTYKGVQSTAKYRPYYHGGAGTTTVTNTGTSANKYTITSTTSCSLGDKLECTSGTAGNIGKSFWVVSITGTGPYTIAGIASSSNLASNPASGDVFAVNKGLNGKPYLSFNITTADDATNYTWSGTNYGASLSLGTALAGVLSNSGVNSYTIVILCRSNAYGTVQNLISQNTSGAGKFEIMAFGSKWYRYNFGASTVVPIKDTAQAICVSTNMTATNTATETLYLNTAQNTPSTQYSQFSGITVPAAGAGALTIGNYTNNQAVAVDTEIYEIAIYNRALTNSEWAQIEAYWNTIYGQSFNTSAGALTTGVVSVTSQSSSGFTLTSSNPFGGTSPDTYQWYESSVSGTKGGAISGATSISYIKSGLPPKTTRYYTLDTTDSAGTPATVSSVQVAATTFGSVVVPIGIAGDSISLPTYGESTGTAIPRKLAALYPDFNPSIIANTSVGGLKILAIAGTPGTYLQPIVDGGAKWLLLMAGTNDSAPLLYDSNTYTDYAAHLTTILDYMTSRGVKCIVNDIIYNWLGFQNGIVNGINQDTIIQNFNSTIISTITARVDYEAMTFLGTQASHHSGYTLFHDNTSLFSGDKVHPSNSGTQSLYDNWLSEDGPIIFANTTIPTGGLLPVGPGLISSPLFGGLVR